MRVDALHRRIVRDVRRMHEAVVESLPVQMPVRYESIAVNLRAFLDRLNEVTEPLGLFNELQTDNALEPGQVAQGGLWLGKSQLPENGSHADLRVIWHVNPVTRRIQWTPPEWTRRRHFFWQMFMHELVHRYQATHRPVNQDIRVYRPRSTERSVKEAQEYHGNCDEIEAYSHDAAVELLTWWPHLSCRDAKREALAYSGRLITPTYSFYVGTFGDTPRHPALLHFKRKLRAWYDVVKKNPEIYELIQLPNLVM